MAQTATSADVTLCHPEWLTICVEIGRIFLEGTPIYQRALDAVIAHQLDDDERSRKVLQKIGIENGGSLRGICERYRIELPT
jgi:hypothetical protein